MKTINNLLQKYLIYQRAELPKAKKPKRIQKLNTKKDILDAKA